ncbi:hypothetical protein BO85DRAFT_384914 [Aspergillus piperis CBS 112811]|uniref:Glycoside hydrolase n=1 Tax=Aspergillus piperis CBS 112811 TaxID=1448313 RepID=A0A8G1QSV7_9EURO|nr:hypothetical protein BO85DRAFT_384914 [Aspergillus piperis CBS 112811]RAH51974.1 hypothetical protein BO85DRAFT_384914 [Aspergillus piperis CBS 112811]
MVKLLPTFVFQAVFALAAAEYLNCTTNCANGVNLGGWLEQECTIDTTWVRSAVLILERRYATYITTSDIDNLANAGLNILRIPTTYASWVSFLNNIATYAITKHYMQLIIGVPSLLEEATG